MSARIAWFYHRNVPRATGKWIINDKLNTKYDKLHPKLPFKVRNKKYIMKSFEDIYPGGQLEAYNTPLSDLFRDERVLLNINKATELRGYAERLIVEAMRNGDCHRPTMELADFFLREKNLIHKLFKVLVPRYLEYTTAFTAIHKLGLPYHKALDPSLGHTRWWRGGECVLELKGNFLPPIIRPKMQKDNLLINVLMKGKA